jgi:hypothetical protein
MSHKTVFKHACSWWLRQYTPLKHQSASTRVATHRQVPEDCHLQVRMFLMMENVNISETSVYILETTGHHAPVFKHVCLWSWRQCNPLKRRAACTRVHITISQEAVIFKYASFWWWRQFTSLKHQSTCTRLKLTVFQKTVIFKHACSWWWRHYTALKRRYARVRLHIAMSQKTVIFKHACFWWWRLCTLLKRRRTSARLHGTMPHAYSPPRELEISQHVSYCRIPAVYWALKLSTV